MSSSSYRSQLERKRDQRADADKKAAAARSKENDKRAAAARARSAASSSRSESTIRTRLSEATRYENEANAAGKDAAAWQTKSAGYAREEAKLAKQLSDAELSERKAIDRKRAEEDRRRAQAEATAERDRKRNEQRRDSEAAQAARETSRLHRELAAQISDHASQLEQLRTPRQEKLRLLMLTASGEGDLRVGREQKRIHDAVRSASGRDLIAFDVRPAATGDDLLSGLTSSRPHIVHFSGHANESVIVFEEDTDEPNPGVVVSGTALAAALGAVDEPPLLVVLNACSSAQQAQRIADGIARFAIGHSDSIADSDAIAYAARFYAALADGQSIGAAHELAKAALQMIGTPDFDLPTLFCADGADPRGTYLVLPPSEA